MTEKIAKFKEIMARYRNGEFGENHLTLKEILDLAGEPNLIKSMTQAERAQLASMTKDNKLKKFFFDF